MKTKLVTDGCNLIFDCKWLFLLAYIFKGYELRIYAKSLCAGQTFFIHSRVYV